MLHSLLQPLSFTTSLHYSSLATLLPLPSTVSPNFPCPTSRHRDVAHLPIILLIVFLL